MLRTKRGRDLKQQSRGSISKETGKQDKCKCKYKYKKQQQSKVKQASDNTLEKPSGKRKSLSFALLMCMLMLAIDQCAYVDCVVVYQLRFITTKQGRTDYALAGESLELSCHYMMKDEAEDVKQVVWSKDGKNFLRWRKNKPGLEVLSYTFKGHIDPSSQHSHITIHNATIDMHGKYKCSIKTDLGLHEMEQDFVVISDSGCKLTDWRVLKRPAQCSEVFRLDCRNMFPKPVPSCGLWNGKLDKFIRSVMVDISEESNKPQTYRVRYDDKFDLPLLQNTPPPVHSNQQQVASSPNSSNQLQLNTDLFQYAGHLMFKCDIIVPETSWKLSITHRMFDYYDACHQDPLEAIDQLLQIYPRYAANRLHNPKFAESRMLPHVNSTMQYELMSPKSNNHNRQPLPVELNCWRKPRLGSLARLTCSASGSSSKHVKLEGSNYLECQSAGWMPIKPPFKSRNDLHKKGAARSRIPQPLRPSRRVDELDEDDDSNQQQGSTTSPNDLHHADDEQTTNDPEEQASDKTNDLSTELSSSNQSQDKLSKIKQNPADESGYSPDQSEYIPVSSSPASLPLLQPEQIALLPRCIIKKSAQSRLPLLEASSASSESSPNRRKNLLAASNQNNDNNSNKPRYSIFNLSVSSSAGNSRQLYSIVSFESRVLMISLHLLLTMISCCYLSSTLNPYTRPIFGNKK